ncbi:uncharacterized protein LOC130520365 isoform X2 [Takifugu flavidus]|uniref:uncharacterized protein LOC130520365 isoform X2 n=1 Tax=Takifugu flavidus TaxID=433684 RepID=UPI0025446180|nr:uncharacterized protein LOC130520365 isoform X2 [Takifugu flavidus]
MFNFYEFTCNLGPKINESKGQSHPGRSSVFSVTWKKFYVHLAGCTGGAHLPIVDLLKQLNQSEVFSPEESDYIVVFCPVRSHIRTDISVALETVPALKPTILVVLHHTLTLILLKLTARGRCATASQTSCSPWTVFSTRANSSAANTIKRLTWRSSSSSPHLTRVTLISHELLTQINSVTLDPAPLPSCFFCRLRLLIHVCSSPQKVPAPELCVSFTPVLHQLVIRGRGGLICCAGCLHTCS